MQSDSINADMYFKVERKSRQEKGSTIVSLLISKPTEGSAGTDSLHYLSMDQAKTYLNELVPQIEAYKLETVIKDQNESLIKAESRLKNLMNDGADLEAKRVNLDKKISENKADQQKQVNEIESQKQKLAGSVSQRKA